MDRSAAPVHRTTVLTAPASTEVVAPARRRVGHVAALGGIGLAAAALYTAAGFQRYQTFRAGSYDLVIFDQAVRSYSHFHLPVAVVKGVHNGFGLQFSVLGDHFSPILAVLAPLYWLFGGPRTLLVAQGVLFAAAIGPLWVLARRELGPVAAYGVTLGYVLAWPVAQAVTFDFHEVAFAPLISAILFERVSAYRRDGAPWWHPALAAAVLLTVKEDMGLLVFGLGLALLLVSVRQRRIRWLGLGFAVAGPIAVVVTSQFVLPAFGGRADYYWRYGSFGSSAGGALWTMLTDPARTAHTLVTPDIKVHTVVNLLAVAALLPLLSPYLLAVVPLLAERMLADAPHWWGTDFHYNAFLVVPLLCAGIDGAARLRRWSRPLSGHWPSATTWLFALAVVVFGIVNVPNYGLRPVLSASAWRVDPGPAAALARVPDGVVVEAPNNLGPHLSDRDRVLLWDRLPRWAPWVVADTGNAEFPFCDLAEQRARVTSLEGVGYQVVSTVDGYVVLHHPGPLPPLDTAPSPGCP